MNTRKTLIINSKQIFAMNKLYFFIIAFLLSFGQMNAQTYCTPTFTSGCASGDQINNFKIPLAGFNHLNTGCSAGAYGNFYATHTITLQPTIPYPFQVDHAYSSQYIKIWVDFNNDGTFTDAAPELVATANAGSTQTTNGTITIPLTVPPGTYRMRVGDKWLSNPVPCANSGFGEAHDYKLVVTTPPTCLMPTNLNVTNVTPTGATLNWTGPTPPPAGGYEYYLSTSPTPPGTATVGTTIGATTANVTVVGGTTYYWWVRSVCSATDKSIWSPGPSFTPGQIGSGNGTTSYLPVYSCYGYNYSQQIYTAAEMASAVGPNQVIKKIRFKVGTPASNPAVYNNWTIYMGNTSQGNFATTTSWIPLTAMSQVYSGPTGAITAGTWIEFTLALPFIWDGASNVVIAVDENIPGYSCTTTWASYAAGANRGMLYYSDTTNPNPATPPTATSRYTDIPQLQLVGDPLPPCSANPPTGLQASQITPSSANITWMPAANATYQIRYKLSTASVWTTVTSNVSVLALSNLLEASCYNVEVSYVCNGVVGNPATITFCTPPVTWCPITTTTTPVTEYISTVSITPTLFPATPMTSNSGPSNYTDYFNDPNRLVTLVIGSTQNQISVSKSWTGTPVNEAVYAWIDFNRDGDFDDSGELIMNSPPSQTTPAAQLFDVPANAYNAGLKTRMRVLLKRSSAPTSPCVNYADGEVEDYAVKLNVEIPCSSAAPTNVAVSAITFNSATVTWTADPGGATYLLRYRPVGGGNWTTIPLPSLTAAYNLTNLLAATLYEVEIAAVCNNIPGPYTHIEFTTKCDPAPPTSLTVANITSTTADVTWDPVLSATYVLQYRKVGTTAWLPTPPIAVNGTSYTLTNLLPYTTYEVRVASVCSGATNPYTTPQVFTTRPTCDMAPIGLTVTNITMTQAQVDWAAFPGATYVLRYRKVGATSWTTVTLTTNTYLMTGLTETTQYELQVSNICNGTQGAWTAAYIFTTPSVLYCNMSSSSSANEFISNVTVTPNGKPEMKNDSGSTSYSDFTNTPAAFIELMQGSTGNQISVAKSWVGTNNPEAVTVWIDFNRDGVFANSERILVSGPSTATPVSATFNVPADAYVSLDANKYVVMRVAMSRDSAPPMCSTFANGEVEDYKVRISKAFPTNMMDPNLITIYPNPTKNILNITRVADGSKYSIYNSVGQIVKRGIIVANKVDVTQLINGVYVIDIESTAKETAQIKFIKE